MPFLGQNKYQKEARQKEERMKKMISHFFTRPSFPFKRARDGDRTRDPLLGKEVLHR